MRAAIKSEFRKLLTTRTVYGFLAAMIVVPIVTVIDAPTAERAASWHGQQFVFFTSFLTRVLLLVLGIRIITDEFRHGTMVPTLLTTPHRYRVLAAKLVIAALAGGLLAAAASLTMLVTAVNIPSLDGLAVGDDAARVGAGFVAAGALWTVLGVGLGAVVRSQILAVVGGLVWLMGIEDVLKGRLGDLADLLPGDAGLTMVVGSSWAHVLDGASILLVFCAALSLGGGIAVARRDID